MKTLHVILPIAGRGSRFTSAGIKTPKPLILVDSQPMFLKSLSSLNSIKANKRYSVVIRQEHHEQFKLGQLIRKNLPDANIITTNDKPIGAVTDAFRARRFLKSNEAVIVMDCDFWFQSQSYSQMVNDSLDDKTNIAGGILTFKADNPRYSYAKLGDDNIVTQTAEKVVISNHAITGAYFFATAKHFFDAAKKLMAQPISEKMPEYYISFLYNILIDEGKKIQAATVDEFESFGTPEELADYQNRKAKK